MNFQQKDLSDLIAANSKNTDELVQYKLKVLRRAKNGLETIEEESGDLKHSATVYKDSKDKSKVQFDLSAEKEKPR